MKRLLGILLIACATLAAQEAAEHAEHAEGDPFVVWKWVNFAILIGGLGYLGSKVLGAAFRSRSEEIRKGIAEARKIKEDAERRAAEIDARVSRLGAEIEEFRAHAAKEMQAEGERIRGETAAAIARLERQAEMEIESAGKTARRELREYAADLALNLAEQRIRAGLDAATEGKLIDKFVADLGQGSRN
jgi:F-type H+-transporting ATPase subunit b